MAMKYRKKPVVIEAIQWTGENHAEMCEFIDPEVLEKMVKEYQDVIVPGYRERAEKAERERDAYKDMIYKERPCAFCAGYTGKWNPECVKCDRNAKEYRPKFRLQELKGD